MYLLQSKLRFFFLFIFFLFSGLGCSDKNEALPYVYVDEYISIIPTLANVGAGGYYILEGKGVNGILIFHNYDGTYQAYDMTCMHKPRSENCVVEMDISGWMPKCPCCGSVYNLMNDGLPDSGPTELGLHQYNTYLPGNGYLQITN